MFPPQQSTSLDLKALSGICGSISIACWVVVFSPQIIENFRRQSADGLSVLFLVVWLAGDLANILGAVLQGVLPTMIILAVYYTLADIVLLLQVFYYRGFTLSDTPTKNRFNEDEHIAHDETEPLLHPNGPDSTSRDRGRSSSAATLVRQNSQPISAAHLSPATPLLDHQASEYDTDNNDAPAARRLKPPTSALQAILYNTTAVVLVCLSGVFGWWISQRRPSHHHHNSSPEPDPDSSDLHFDPLGQFFGYICAALYLGSRIPQLLLNYRRKSTEGVSLLFFLFACLGNLTYDMSIFAYEPICSGPKGICRDGEWGTLYGRYIAVNASWIAGSLGTLVLDIGIFVQFFLYRKEEGEEEGVGNGNVVGS